MACIVDRSLPKNYQIVYKAIRDAGHGRHLNAYELYVDLRDRKEQVSQTTVYRALERLVALKLIDEVAPPNASYVAYELAAPLHAHFHCHVCGVLRDVALTLPDDDLRNHVDLQDVEIERTVMMFAGRCKSCV